MFRYILPHFLIAILLVSSETAASSARERPDIIIMMADDLGFSDIGCYGSEIPTPNIDALGFGGTRFTEFTNTSRCCPSRASLLTGQYSHQVGIGDMNYKGKSPAYAGQLSKDFKTLPELLRRVGYGTYMVGKWHLTRSDTIDDGPNGSWPMQRGFDHFLGSMEGAKNYFKPKWFFDDESEVLEFPSDFFYTSAIAERVANYIRHQKKSVPMFIYTAFYAPHFPLQAPEDKIDQFKGNYLKGWDELRKQRFEKQKSLKIIPNATRLSPTPTNVKKWDEIAHEKKKELDLRMAIYAAQVHMLDKGVGTITEALKETGRLNNTLIFFLSDNGATNSGGAFGSGKVELLGGIDAELRSTYGAGWANLSNTPYRYFKADTHEGGIKAPLIVHWPERLGRTQRLNRNLTHITDIFPTCLNAAGINTSSKAAIYPGLDLLNENAAPFQKRALFYEHQKSRAVRLGKWKLVNRKKSNDWELYDLSKDPTELMDLSASKRSEVMQLSKMWQDWAKKLGVIISNK